MNLTAAGGIGIAAVILVLLQILIPPLASLVYVIGVRPELGRARR